MTGAIFPDGVVARRSPAAEPPERVGPEANGSSARLAHTSPNGERRLGRERRRERARDLDGLWPVAGYALLDVCCVVSSGALIFLLQTYLSDFIEAGVSGAFGTVLALAGPASARMPANHAESLFLYAALILVFSGWLGLYGAPGLRSARAELLAVIQAVLLATSLLALFLYFTRADVVPQSTILLTLMATAATLLAWRYARRQIVIRRAERGIGTRNVAIIGAGDVGQALALELEQNKHLGYRFKGFLDQDRPGDPRTLGTVDDLWRVARAEFLDEVFITIPSERELVKRIAAEAKEERLAVKVIPELYDGLGWDVPLRQEGGFPVMDIYGPPIPALGLFFKRLLDLALSSAALAAATPLLIILAAWIRLDSPGPVLYRSPRVGKKGRCFNCLKLRTMVSNADELKDGLRSQNEREGPFFKISNDPRITPLGRFLRRCSLDELPQLWNVLQGDMSLVGPRPHPIDDFKRYSLEHFRRLDVKPGLTGLWQVTARRDPSFQNSLRLDLEYIEHWSLLLDLEILLKTVPELFRPSGS